MDITKLAEYGITGVAVAIIIGFILLFKYLLEFINKQRMDYLCEIEKIDKRHSQNVTKLTKALEKNTRVSDQTYQYLKLRNGSLEKSIRDIEHIKGDVGETGEKGEKGEKGESG